MVKFHKVRSSFILGGVTLAAGGQVSDLGVSKMILAAGSTHAGMESNVITLSEPIYFHKSYRQGHIKVLICFKW